MKKRTQVKSLSLVNKLFINMAKKPVKKFSTCKKHKPLERRVADSLVKTHERNEKLKDKNINTSFLDLF